MSVDIPSLIIAFVAACAGIASAVIAWFARADSLRSEQKAEKAQEAAHAASERAASATERMSIMQASVFNSPPWSIEWFGGDTYLLTNTSSIDSVDVTVELSSDRARIQVGMEQSPGIIGARSAVKIMVSRTMATPWELDVIVNWRRPASSEEFTWQHPVPPRGDR